MAKVSFTKLGLTKNTEIKTINWNGQAIEIKQYLSVLDKFDFISDVLNACQDENNFINEAKEQFYFDLEIIFKYTNINFTDKQKEDSAKLYDLFKSSGLLDIILANVPEEELKNLRKWVDSIADNICNYRNSVYGILDAITTDYNSLNLDVEQIREKLADPNSLGLLKDVLTKLG